MKTSLKTSTICFFALIALTLCACSPEKLIQKLQEKKDATSHTAQNPLKDLANNLKTKVDQKVDQLNQGPRQTVNLIVQCYNNIQPKIDSSEESYFRTLNQADKASCRYSRPVPDSMELMRRRTSFTITDSYEKTIEQCKKGLVQTEADAARYGELLNFYRPFVVTYEELNKELAQVETYYKQQNYKDDACALGQKLFNSITEKIDALKGKVVGVALEMDKIKRNLDLSELAEMEKEGKKFDYHYMFFTMQAEDLLKTLHLEQNGRHNAFEYQQVFPNFEKAFQELNTYAASHPDEEAVKQIYNSIKSQADNLYATSKILSRDMATNQVKDDGLDKFLSNYNSYIDAVNRRLKYRY